MNPEDITQAPAATRAGVCVTVVLSIDGNTRSFAASADTDGDGYRLAEGMLSSLNRDADRWLMDQRQGRGGGW